MATTPDRPCCARTRLRAGRLVGRVGGLAVALGIGLAIANSPAIANADDGSTASDTSSSAADSRGADSKGPDSKGSASGAADTGHDEDPEETGPRAGPEDQESEDQESGDEESAEEDPEDEAGEPADDDAAPAEAEADEPEGDASEAGKSGSGEAPAMVSLEAPAAPSDPDSARDTHDPAAPAAALMAVTGTARRELAAAPTTASTTAAPAVEVSPLGTPEQLEAERLAAETVATWPVRLMKFVLTVGWLATAQREYQAIGGPDWENLAQLRQAVDEYAMGAAFQQQLLDSMRPTVVTQVAPPHTWYGQTVGGSRILYDNPDTIYRFMGVNKTSTYVITGRFLGAPPADTSFSVLTGLSGVTAGYLSGRDLHIEPDGSFTITVSSAPAGPGQTNHLQLTAESTLIAVRNTLSDWNTQSPMSLAIERVAGPPNSLFSQLGGFAIPLLGPTVANSPLLTTLVSLIPPMTNPPAILRGTVTAAVMALGLSMEAKYIKVATTDPDTGARTQPNVLEDPTRNAEFLATQLQSAGYFSLADTEALVVTITPNSARYFTVPVTNLWTVTDDYRTKQTSLNIAQAKANPDGSYTIVISPEDPGVHNWVSTGGLNRGTVSIRFQDLDQDSELTPTVTSVVVPLSELGTVLPPTTPYVTPLLRRHLLELRKLAFDRRFAPYPQP
ncbi:DUF1214 domain-containing protein [Mycolicibacterium sp.]|uniref:DUF1214 domain-containing protein n=1 Tax=Mycolicibacterium sp. TaxID=2320850 RepID=UPI003D0C6C72